MDRTTVTHRHYLSFITSSPVIIKHPKQQPQNQHHHPLAEANPFKKTLNEVLLVNQRREVILKSNPLAVQLFQNFSYGGTHKKFQQKSFIESEPVLLPTDVHIFSLQWWPTLYSSRSGGGGVNSDLFVDLMKSEEEAGMLFPHVSKYLVKVQHPKAMRTLYLRIQSLVPSNHRIAKCSPSADNQQKGDTTTSTNTPILKSSSSFTSFYLPSMFTAPVGLCLCAVVETSLDFIENFTHHSLPTTASGEQYKVVLPHGEMIGLVLSYCRC